MTKKELTTAKALIANGGDWNDAVAQGHPNLSKQSVRVQAWHYRRNAVFLAYVDRKIRELDGVNEVLRCFREGMQANSQYKGKDTGLPDHRIRLQAADKLLDLLMTCKEGLDAQLGPSQSEFKEFEAWLEEQPLSVINFMEENDRLPNDEEYSKLLES